MYYNGKRKGDVTIRLTVLETSDIHGQVFPYQVYKHQHVKQGMSFIHAYVQQVKKEEEHVLLIDNGDVMQGSPFMLHYFKKLSNQPNPIIRLLNEIGYDAAVVGNHEFNFGSDLLRQAISESNFPWLSCNIIDETTNQPALGQPYTIKMFGDVRVAIVGATTHFIPNWEEPLHIQRLQFEDAFLSLKKWVPFIRKAENPDLLIVSYHGGFERDVNTGQISEEETGENQAYKICQEINGIDLLLTGHQHRELVGNINGVPVIQPGYNGQAIGKVTVEFKKGDRRFIPEHIKCQIVHWDEVEADESILQLVRHEEKKTHEWLDEKIGYVSGDMQIHDAFQARIKEHPFVELMNNIQMEVTDAPISCTALFTNSMKGFQETITIGDVVTNYIYPNTLKVLEVTGKDIKEALERCATYFDIIEGELVVNPQFSEPKPQHFNYDMWEGIEYTFHIRKKKGERVTSLTYNGEPIREEQLYHVVMNNYRASGGGGYHMFRNKRVVKEIQQDMTELIIDYILRHKTLEAKTNENWKIVK